MIRYAQINLSTGRVIGDSYLSGEINRDNLIPIPDYFDLTNKRYINGAWVEEEPSTSETTEEPTEQDLINAEILLNQAQIMNTQNSMDEVLAEILLNQVGGLDYV